MSIKVSVIPPTGPCCEYRPLDAQGFIIKREIELYDCLLFIRFRYLWNIRLLQCALICSVLALLASCVVLCLFCLNTYDLYLLRDIQPCQFPCEYHSFRGLCCEYQCQNAQGKLKKLQGEKSKYHQIFGGKWYSPNFWVEVCRAVLKTLTLFQTKIYDFSYPFSWT